MAKLTKVENGVLIEGIDKETLQKIQALIPMSGYPMEDTVLHSPDINFPNIGKNGNRDWIATTNQFTFNVEEECERHLVDSGLAFETVEEARETWQYIIDRTTIRGWMKRNDAMGSTYGISCVIMQNNASKNLLQLVEVHRPFTAGTFYFKDTELASKCISDLGMEIWHRVLGIENEVAPSNKTNKD